MLSKQLLNLVNKIKLDNDFNHFLLTTEMINVIYVSICLRYTCIFGLNHFFLNLKVSLNNEVVIFFMIATAADSSFKLKMVRFIIVKYSYKF